MGLMFTGIGSFTVLSAKNALKWPPNKDNFALLFPAIGVLLLVGAVVMAVRQWKYRGTLFRMETMPGVIGGKLRGVLVIPDMLGNNEQITIRLTNEERKTSGSGKNSHTYVRVLFEQEKTVTIADYSRNGYTLAGPGQVEVPVEFVLPFDTKDETDNYGKCQYTWRLKAKADVPGLDMSFEFMVPVFRTQQSRNELTTDTMETAAAQEKLQALKQNHCQSKEIAVVFQNGGEHYVSKTKGYIPFVIGAVIVAIGFGLVGCGIVKVMNVFHGGGESVIDMVLASVFALVPAFLGFVFLFIGGIIFLLGLFTMGRREVYVADGAVHYCRRLAMFNFNKRIDREFIVDITVKRNGSVNGKILHAVRVEHTDLGQVSGIERYVRSKAPRGKISNIPLETAINIYDKAEALWLADRLKEQLGISKG